MIVFVFILLIMAALVIGGTANDWANGASGWNAIAGLIAGLVMAGMAVYLYSVSQP